MRSHRDEAGSATAELAVGLPVLVLLLLAALTAVSAVTQQMRCVDAAREAARAAARGEPDPLALGRRIAPRGADLQVRAEGSMVRVTVRVAVRPLGRGLPGPTVSGDAVAEREPGAVP